MPFSIAYLVSKLPNKNEVFLAIEARELVKAGVKVYIFGLRRQDDDHENLIKNQHLTDIDIQHFPYLASLRIWHDVWYWLKKHPLILWHIISMITRLCWKRPRLWLQSLVIVPKSFRIARLVKDNQIDIVHAAWGHYPAVTAYLIKRLLPQVQITLALGAYDRLMKHPMTKVAAENAVTIITQSEASADLIQHEWPRPSVPVMTIMRGVDFNLIDSILPIKKTDGLIVSAGRLVQEKGYQYLISAFAEVHKKHPKSRLLIIGKGDYQNELVKLAADLGINHAVEISGYLPQEILFQRIAQGKIFVLASVADYDNLPNVIKEAMALELAVITTPTTGIEALIENGKTGFLVGMGDVEGLAEKIILLLDNPELDQRVSKNGRKRVKTLFDVSETTHQRIALYQDILSK